jgi:hypothetical protein
MRPYRSGRLRFEPRFKSNDNTEKPACGGIVRVSGGLPWVALLFNLGRRIVGLNHPQRWFWSTAQAGLFLP